MDKYEKCAASLMELGDKILEKKKHRNMLIRRISFSCASAFAAVIVVFFAWKSAPPKIEIPSDTIISETTTIPESTYTDITSAQTTSLVSTTRKITTQTETTRKVATTSGAIITTIATEISKASTTKFNQSNTTHTQATEPVTSHTQTESITLVVTTVTTTSGGYSGTDGDNIVYMGKKYMITGRNFAVDASIILANYAKYSTSSDKPSVSELSAQDINNDGLINAVDASMVLSYYAYVSVGGNLSFSENLNNSEKTVKTTNGWNGKPVSSELYTVLSKNTDEKTVIAVSPRFNSTEQYKYNGKTMAEYLEEISAIFGVISLIFAMMWAWQKNVRNKSRYAFENYQRDLTDHLAHDIKTPLMAISGYSETVMNVKLTEEEKKEFLSSILDNVSFIDSLTSRIIYLNHIDRKIVSKEIVQLNDMVSDILSKYVLLLQEKNIVYSISGSARIHSERAAMETIIENLVANAVKYTPNNGMIKIEIGKKNMIVTNPVIEEIDTSELKRPFVRGDLARSNIEKEDSNCCYDRRVVLY